MQRLLALFCEDPDWVHEMFDYLGEFFVSLSEQLLEQIVPDVCWIGGDFCCNTGPIMSPRMFSEFFVPVFKKVTSVYRHYGVPVILMHTDGDFRPLGELFRESGATGIHPCEVTNGQTVDNLRKEFPWLQLLGGIDKRAIARGKEAIDRELESKIPFLAQSTGYIPYIDHSIPPDVSFENFSYYRKRLAEMIQRK